jgi:hypothetical protein
MKAFRWPLAVLFCVAVTTEAEAQLFFGPPFGNGIHFHYHRRHLSVGGRFGGGYVVPVHPYLGPVAPPIYGVAPYGVTSTRVTVNYLGPPSGLYSGPRLYRPLAENYDLSGVDLDVEPPPRPSVSKKLPAAPAAVQVKKPAAAPPTAPPPAPAQLPPGLPPGLDVSKTRKTARPEDPAQPKDKKDLKQSPPSLSVPEEEPVKESARLIALGLTAFGAEEYGLAAQRFHRAVSVQPANARAHFLLSQAQFALGKFREAVTTIEAGMNLDRKWPAGSFRPRMELYQGIEPDFDLHLKRLRETAEKHADVYAFQFLLGHELWFDGRRAEAMIFFQKARPLAADPVFVDAFLKIAEPGLIAVK